MNNVTLPPLPHSRLESVAIVFDGGTSVETAVREATVLSAWLGVPVTGTHNSFEFTVDCSDTVEAGVAEWDRKRRKVQGD